MLGTNFSILNAPHSYRLGLPVAVQTENDKGSAVSLGNASAPELPSYWTDSFCMETLPEGFQPRQLKDRLLRSLLSIESIDKNISEYLASKLGPIMTLTSRTG